MWNVYMRRMHICMKCICAFHAYVHGIYSKYMRAGKEGISEIIRIGVHISAVSEWHELLLKLDIVPCLYRYRCAENLK